MRLLIDMNLSPRWVEFLSEHGIQAMHWSKVGASDASDATIMAYAAETVAVVLTHDLDFGGILAATRGSKPSVVQIRADDVSPEAIGQAVVRALGQVADDLERGALLTAEPGRDRLRLLPLGSR
jgi:predicted nuclease of predicted toxin-antitoxin system